MRVDQNFHQIYKEITNTNHLIFIILLIIIFFSVVSAQEQDVVLAVDTSGSLIQDNGIETIKESIPIFIKNIEKYNNSIRLGIVSWDDNIDFIVKPTRDYQRILMCTSNFSASEYEYTDLSVGMNGGIQALEGSNGKKIIIFIIDSSEFKSFSNLPNKNEYVISFIIMNAYYHSKLIDIAVNISQQYNGEVIAILGFPDALANALNKTLKKVLDRSILNLTTAKYNLTHPEKHIASSEIVDLINSNNSIKLDSIRVEGDLNISKHIFRNNFIMTNSIINGSLNLTGSVFIKPLILHNTIFKGKVNFDEAKLKNDLDLEDTRFFDEFLCRNGEFRGKSSFFNSSFISHADFSGSTFLGPISFANALFNSSSSFYQTTIATEDISFRKTKFLDNSFFIETSFNGTTYFEDNLFEKSASFNYALFRDTVVFKKLTFEGDSKFSNSVFLGDVLFNQVNFNRNSDFHEAKLEKGLVFIKSNLSNTLEIDNSRINGSFKAEGTKFNNGINFINSYLYNLYLDNNILGSLIRLNNTNIMHISTHWNYLRGNLEFDPSIYQFMLKNYKELDWLDDYDSCLYDQKYTRMKNEPLGLSKILDSIAWISCGFGLRLSFIFIWSFLIVFFFGFLYYILNALEKTSSRSKLLSTMNGISLFDAFYFSSILFVAQAPSEFKPIRKYRYLVIIEGILGWLFLGLLISVMIAKFTR